MALSSRDGRNAHGTASKALCSYYSRQKCGFKIHMVGNRLVLGKVGTPRLRYCDLCIYLAVFLACLSPGFFAYLMRFSLLLSRSLVKKEFLMSMSLLFVFPLDDTSSCL